MQNLQKYSIVAILTLSIVAGLFNNIPSFAQEGNQTATPMANQTQTATEEQYSNTEAGYSAEEEGKEYDKTSTVRDSVTVLLQDRSIPAGDFIHLYDSTPSHIMNGHIALKAPCGDDSTSPIQVLIGSAPNMTAATLENVPSMSTPGEEDIEFPPTSTVVIGINKVMKVEYDEHSEGAAEHASTSTAEAGHTE